VSRRTALGAVLLGTGAAAAGCDGTDQSAPVEETPADRTQADETPTEVPTEPAEEDPDVSLLREQLAGIVETAALVTATSRRHRPLRRQLRALQEMHAAHRDVLGEAAADGTAEPSGARGRVPRRKGQALAAVRGREEQLAAALERGAVAAESGSFARALASMSASVTQHLAEVPR
jgi:hypothetical protein